MSRIIKRRLWVVSPSNSNTDVFDNVPEVKTFCFCLNLKWGSVAIAIITAIDSLFLIINPNPITNAMSGCNYQYSPRCEARKFLRFLFYFETFRGIVNIAASCALLIGIFMKQKIIVTIFLTTLSLHITLGIVLNIMVVLASCLWNHCLMGAFEATYCFVVVIFGTSFYLYFLLVVKSFRSGLVDVGATDYFFEAITRQARLTSDSQNSESQGKIESPENSGSKARNRSDKTSGSPENTRPGKSSKPRDSKGPQVTSGSNNTDGPQKTSRPQESSEPNETNGL